jgi:hypothetical protein
MKEYFKQNINEAEYDDGCFKFCNSQFLNVKKISHDIETNLMSDNTLFFNLSISLLFYGSTKLTQKSMLVSTYWPYYSEMECKENYRRVMAACGRKVYDNYKYIIHFGQRSPRC